MTRLWLVRHGPPAIDTSAPASTWPLSAVGVAAVEAARESWSLPVDPPWVSSPEPKAHQTAQVLRGAEVATIDDLREAERPARWNDDAEHSRLVERSMAEPERPVAPEWEPAGRTRERVVSAVRAVLAAGPTEVVLVGHGTAWTLLVADLTGCPPDLVGWRAMRFPDRCLLVLDPAGHAQIKQPWGS